MRFQLVITPTLPSLLAGEGENLGFRMETILAKKEGVMQKQKKTCPLFLLTFLIILARVEAETDFFLLTFS